MSKTKKTSNTENRKNRTSKKTQNTEYTYYSEVTRKRETLAVGKAYPEEQDGILTYRIFTQEDADILHSLDNIDTASRWHLYGMVNKYAEFYKEEAGACYKRGVNGKLKVLPTACSYDPEEIFIRKEEQEAKQSKRDDFEQKIESVAIRVLTESDYVIYHLHRTGFMTLEEIGDQFNVHKSTVSRYIDKAYKKIADELLKEYPADEIYDLGAELYC